MTLGRPRRVAATSFTVLAALACILNAGAPSFADDVAKQKFLAEYPKAAKRLAESLATVKGSITLSETLNNETGTAKGEFAIDHEYSKLTYDEIESAENEKNTTRNVFCGKDRKVFALRKLSTSQAYIVTDASFSPRSDAANELDEKLLWLVRAPYRVDWIDLAATLSGKEYLIDDVSESAKDGMRTFIVLLRHSTDSSNRMRIELDPDLGWAIRHSVWEQGNDERMRSEYMVQYGPMIDGIPLPRTVTHRDGSRSYRCDFDRISREPTPSAEFGMEYYGLPNIYAPNNFGGMYLWALVAAISCLAVLGIFGVIRHLRGGR